MEFNIDKKKFANNPIPITIETDKGYELK